MSDSNGNIAKISSVRIENDRVKLSMINPKTNSVDHYSAAQHCMSCLVINNTDVIMCIDGAPKQVIYCDNMRETESLVKIFCDAIGKDNIETCESNRGEIFYINKANVPLIVYKEGRGYNSVVICFYGLDKDSRNMSFTQSIILDTKEQCEELINRLES